MKQKAFLLFCIIQLYLLPLPAQHILSDSLPPQWEVSNDYFARFAKFSPAGFREIGAVNDIVQDRTGFMWLAGENGLGRFDGYEFKVYQANINEQCLSGSLISSLLLDSNGDIWVGHSAGLSRYNKFTDSFTNVFGAYTPFGSYADSNYVRAMFLDADSLIWFETLDGWLHTYSIESMQYQKMAKHRPIDQAYYHYHAISRSVDGELYVGGRGVGPYIYDEANKKFETLAVNNNDLPGFKREYDVSLILPYKNAQTWIGGLEGLYLFDRNHNYFQKYFQGTVYDFIRDKKNNYWLGTGRGAFKINIKTGQAKHYQLDNNDPGSLNGERIYDIYEDRSGRLWFAHENGVSTYLPSQDGLSYMFHVPGIENTPASSRITSLVKKSASEIWVGTADEGLDLMQLKSLQFKHFQPDNYPGILSKNIRNLQVHPDGTLYIAYWAGKGFGRYFSEKKLFQNFRFDAEGLTQDWYNDFAFNTQGDVYIGFWGGPGLTLFKHEQGKFGEVLAQKLPDKYNARLITRLLAKDDQLWISTSNSGLIRYDSRRDTAYTYHTEINAKGGIDAELVHDVAADNNGNIWAAAQGLYLYDSKLDAFNKVPIGLHFNRLQIYSISADSQNKLWLLTSKGLMKYDAKNKFTTDYSMLVNISFNASQAAILQLDSNKILIGGANGMALIETDKLGFKHRFPKVFLTHLDVFNEEFIPFIDNKEAVELAYDQNFFTINFGTDRWESSNLYTYYYKLEGFDNQWRSLTSEQRSVYFTNVPAGSFHFKMRTGDAYGNRGEQEASLKIEVVGPWWKQWWFISLLAVLVISVAVMLWFVRLRDVKMKLLNIELNQKLLRLQMNPHFIFNSLTSIQSYIYSNQKHLAGQYLSDFARLIRLILENSRHERINLQKEIETISLYMELQQLRFTNRFSFEVIVDPDIDKEITFVPPMMVQPFLENALEHGLKNKTNGIGKIQVKYALQKNTLQYEVRDNGVGLAAAAQQSKLHKGESLSIAICKERLQLIEKQSKIKINFVIEEIKENGSVKGTRVVITVPLMGKFIKQNH
ncbi:MAG: two-component regulator propeller domain-containing protein [Bacteroidales bacterium]|jgi:ligand-binding sensor domain-containing protein/two-component sensor histidine kinase|nr:two-component regulator propeller domain-containing protein [Bacteroidales bacterium]